VLPLSACFKTPRLAFEIGPLMPLIVECTRPRSSSANSADTPRTAGNTPIVSLEVEVVQHWAREDEK